MSLREKGFAILDFLYLPIGLMSVTLGASLDSILLVNFGVMYAVYYLIFDVETRMNQEIDGLHGRIDRLASRFHQTGTPDSTSLSG